MVGWHADFRVGKGPFGSRERRAVPKYAAWILCTKRKKARWDVRIHNENDSEHMFWTYDSGRDQEKDKRRGEMNRG